MKALTTKKLDDILKNNPVTSRFFHGTYPSCMSPNTSKKKYSFITNTDSHELGGVHWCAWMVDGKNITFFDSFGRHPRDPAFSYKDIFKGFNVKYNKTQVQDFSSSTCGHYCIQFLYILSLGLDLNFMLKDYGSNFKKNDIVVYNFFKNL